MPRYKKMYFYLFNKITDALRALEAGQPQQAADILRKAQQETEEMYCQAGE